MKPMIPDERIAWRCTRCGSARLGEFRSTWSGAEGIAVGVAVLAPTIFVGSALGQRFGSEAVIVVGAVLAYAGLATYQTLKVRRAYLVTCAECGGEKSLSWRDAFVIGRQPGLDVDARVQRVLNATRSGVDGS